MTKSERKRKERERCKVCNVELSFKEMFRRICAVCDRNADDRKQAQRERTSANFGDYDERF